MINCQILWKTFKSKGLTYFTGVPDSTFKEWINFLNDNNGKGSTNRIAAIERDAIGWAAGYNVATGKIPCVYMQNSGLGNCVNPITSLIDSKVYDIPLLLMIGWRGEPGVHDEPQHIKMGRVTLALLEVLKIKYSILSDNIESAKLSIDEAVKYITETGSPYAFVIKSKTFEDYRAKDELCDYEMTREEAIKTIVDAMREDGIIVSTTGKTSRELFEYRESKKTGHEKDFLMVGSMGLASSFAAEIALQKPQKKVFVFDGDGAAIMSAGNLATIGFYSPQNLHHIIFDNGSHDSTGGQPTVSAIVNFEKLALSCGYKSAKIIQSKRELEKILAESNERPQMLVIKVKKGTRKDLGRPTIIPLENKKSFMEFLSEGEKI